MLQEELHSRVIRLIREGYLPPLRQPQPISAGSGDGSPCDVCGQPIASDDVQYEIEHAERLQTIRVHLRCHDIWKESLRQRK